MRRRLLIVEEPLRDYSGHYFEVARLVADSNRRAGVEVDLAVHRNALPGVLHELRATPVFRFTSCDGLYRRKGVRRVIDCVRHGGRMLGDLRRFLHGRERYDLIYVASVTSMQLPAWRMLLALDSGRRFGQLVLHMRFGQAKYPESSWKPVFKKKTRRVARVLRSFEAPAAQGRVRFVTDSRRLAAEYEHLCGLDLEVIPHPAVRCPMAAAERCPGPVLLSALGAARGEKGTMLIQRAIRLIFKASPEFPARFVIHWGGRFLDPLLERDPVLDADARVEFLDRELSPDEYRQRLLESDCILLPYDRERYTARISAVAVEAEIAGIPTIHTNDTWLDAAASEWGCGIGIEDGDAEDLAEKIRVMVSDIEKYRVAARERSEAARRHYSPENHQRLLWRDG